MKETQHGIYTRVVVKSDSPFLEKIKHFLQGWVWKLFFSRRRYWERNHSPMMTFVNPPPESILVYIKWEKFMKEEKNKKRGGRNEREKY